MSTPNFLTAAPAFAPHIINFLYQFKYITAVTRKMARVPSPPNHQHPAAISTGCSPRDISAHSYTQRRAYYYFCDAVAPIRSLVKLQFRDWPSSDTRIVQQPIAPGFDGSAHLGYRRVHSPPHCVAARLQFSALISTCYCTTSPPAHTVGGYS